MYYSDEELSAFLDQELPAEKMHAIRESIVNDDSLADRLAILSQVDTSVCEFIHHIDRVPAPQALLEKVTAPFAQPEAQAADAAANNVVAFGLWRKTENFMRDHIAMAASVALIVGVAAGSMLLANPMRSENSQWAEINQALNSLPSGEYTVLASGDELHAQFSFTTATNELCRSYLVSNQRVRQEVACRAENAWQVIASAYQASPELGEYGVASASPVVDAVLLQLGAGATLSLAEENALLKGTTQR